MSWIIQRNRLICTVIFKTFVLLTAVAITIVVPPITGVGERWRNYYHRDNTEAIVTASALGLITGPVIVGSANRS